MKNMKNIKMLKLFKMLKQSFPRTQVSNTVEGLDGRTTDGDGIH